MVKETAGLAGSMHISHSFLHCFCVFFLFTSLLMVDTNHKILHAFYTSLLHLQPYSISFLGLEYSPFFTTFSDICKVLIFFSGSNLEQVMWFFWQNQWDWRGTIRTCTSSACQWISQQRTCSHFCSNSHIRAIRPLVCYVKSWSPKNMETAHSFDRTWILPSLCTIGWLC